MLPGLYIIKSETTEKCSYLEVTVQGSQVYYTINGIISSMFEDESQLDGFEVLGKIKEINPKNGRFSFEWTDQDGNNFETNFGHVNEIAAFFSRFPPIAKMMGSKKKTRSNNTLVKTPDRTTENNIRTMEDFKQFTNYFVGHHKKVRITIDETSNHKYLFEVIQ